MRMSGKVTLLREVQKLESNGVKYIEINGEEKGAVTMYYTLFSSNPRQFDELLKLRSGDLIHFSSASLAGIKYYMAGKNTPGSILKVDLNQADISVQLQERQVPKQETPKQEEVKAEPVKEQDFGFNEEVLEETDVLSNDWEGSDLGI